MIEQNDQDPNNLLATPKNKNISADINPIKLNPLKEKNQVEDKKTEKPSIQQEQISEDLKDNNNPKNSLMLTLTLKKPEESLTGDITPISKNKDLDVNVNNVEVIKKLEIIADKGDKMEVEPNPNYKTIFPVNLFLNSTKDCICYLCHGVAENPVYDCCFGKSCDMTVFCEKCLRKCIELEGKPICPVSKMPFNEKCFDSQFRQIREKIANLRMKCGNFDKGCNWQNFCVEYRAHLEVCPKETICCSNEGCNLRGLREIIIPHEKICGFLLCECDLCHKTMCSQDIKNHKDTECPGVSIECPNKCGELIKRGEKFEHLGSCQNQEIYCPFILYDCQKTFPRKDLNKQIQDDLLKHTSLILENFDVIRRDYVPSKTKGLETFNDKEKVKNNIRKYAEEKKLMGKKRERILNEKEQEERIFVKNDKVVYKGKNIIKNDTFQDFYPIIGESNKKIFNGSNGVYVLKVKNLYEKNFLGLGFGDKLKLEENDNKVVKKDKNGHTVKNGLFFMTNEGLYFNDSHQQESNKQLISEWSKIGVELMAEYIPKNYILNLYVNNKKIQEFHDVKGTNDDGLYPVLILKKANEFEYSYIENKNQKA